jgi:hypothetical protein
MKPMLIKSSDALAWLQAARLQVPPEARRGLGSAERPIVVSCWCRYASRRPDLSIELVLDLLEETGVISNDRYVFETHAYKEICPEDPGVDVIVEERE